MGRANVSVNGRYEGLFYIDKEYLTVYRRYLEEDDAYETCLQRELSFDEQEGSEWYFDEYGTMEEEDYALETFSERFSQRFPSFTIMDDGNYSTWLRNGPYGYPSRLVILENELFYVCAEDNEWSKAIELIQKEAEFGPDLSGLQARHYETYLNGIRDVLLEQFDQIWAYSGPWTSSPIRKENQQ